MNDRPLITGNRIDQAALAHIRLPGQDHLPRPDKVQTGGSVGQEGIDLLSGRVFRAGLQRRLDLCDRALKLASILVEENCRRTSGAGLGQGQPGGGGKRVGLLVDGPFLPGFSPATIADKNLFDAGDRRQSAVAVQFDHCIGISVNHDFLAAGTKPADNDSCWREIGRGSAATRDEVSGDQVKAPGPSMRRLLLPRGPAG